MKTSLVTDREKSKRGALLRTRKYEIWAKTNGHCWWCGCMTAIGHNFTIEHLTPMAEGGGDDLTNLAAACRRCNVRRGKRGIRFMRRYLSNIPFFSQAQVAYLARLGVVLPEPDYQFYFEHRGLEMPNGK